MTDWNKRYQDNQIGWDLGKPSSPHKAYIDQLDNKQLRILIPGAGNAYEAEYLFNQGFSNVTIIDVAISPIHNLKTRVPSFPDKHLIHGDFFEHSGKYDLILEQTFFCAIDPSLRPDYVAKVKELLSDKGKLVGLLFNRTFENNPPYGGDQKSYQSLFSQHFGDIYMEPCYNSIPARSGSELFISIS